MGVIGLSKLKIIAIWSAAFVTYSVVTQIIYFRSFIVFLQALEVALFCILLIAQWRYDLENVVVFLLLVALLGKFNL